MIPDIDREELERISNRYDLDMIVVFGYRARRVRF